MAIRVRDDAHGEQVIDLIDASFLANRFAMHGIQAFDARFEFRRDTGFDEFRADGGLDFLEEFFVKGSFIADFFLQSEEGFGFEIAESEIFEFAADNAHSEAMGDRRVDVQSFARDALLLFRVEIFERAHVVEAIGQLDENDTDIVHHGQQHLADVFGLTRFGRHHVQAADFRHAFDKASDFFAEAFGDAGDGILGVFDGVMKNRGGERGGVEAHVGENVGDFEEMREVGLPGTAKLVVVAFGSDFVGAAHHPGIFGWAILT
jgi:hypothetical protein